MTYSFIKDQNKLGTFSSFIFLLLLSLFISTGSFSQLESASSELINNKQSDSPFDAVKGKKEVVSKRDLFSKHYINKDGSYTALIGAGPIHYEKAGQFLDIDHEIITETDPSGTYSYANKTNLFESYFGATSNKGVKNKTPEGEIREFLNTTMYWEVNGQATNTISSADVPVSIDNDKAYYNNLFGNISAEFITLTGKRKLNFVISSAQDLGNIPVGAEYLVFTEDVELPNNWTHSVRDQGVYLLSSTGEEVYLYENPSSTDAAQELTTEVNTIFETEVNGSVLTIKTKVKTEWLLDGEREFPVKVDPTVNVYPDNAMNWTRSADGFGNNYTNLRFGIGSGGGWFVTSMKYNTTSITSGSIVNGVQGYFYLTEAYEAWGGGVRYAYSLDPMTNSGINLYNGVTGVLSNDFAMQSPNSSWKNQTLNATGVSHVQNNIAGTVILGLDPTNGYSYLGQYYAAVNHTNNNRPYLVINYTPPALPPSCATLISPQNGINDAAHSGSLTWEPVSGAESYDVYFGTSPTPPLVSTSQTGTSYNVGSCLPPETTYYWKIVPKNSYGEATGCSTWSFTTDNKLHIYKNDWETATEGYFGTSGVSVDGWYTNNNSGINIGGNLYSNQWTVGSGPNAINGKSAGVTATLNGGLAATHFDYWSDLGVIYRWIYRPFDMTGLRDIELEFNWKGGGEYRQDYGNIASSINGGANWLTDNQGGLYSDGEYWNSPNTVQSQALTFPSTRNNQSNFQLAFKWNDLSGNGLGGLNSFIVDDIVIKACPFEGTLSSPDETSPYTWIPPTSNTTTTINVNGSHSCAYYEWERSTDDGLTWTVVAGATDASYVTPSDITVTTLYRSRVFFGSGCSGVYQDEAFEILLPEDPLPVELTHFSTSCETGEPSIRWETASETNSAVFVVQFSADGKSWEDVKTIKAAGNSTSTRNYAVSGKRNQHGITYYRLVQKDFNGDQEIFGPISSTCVGNESSMTVYPNPNKGTFTIEISSDKTYSDAQLYLTDMTGKVISSQQVDVSNGTTQILFNNIDLQKGAYMITLRGGGLQLKPVKVIVN